MLKSRVLAWGPDRLPAIGCGIYASDWATAGELRTDRLIAIAQQLQRHGFDDEDDLTIQSSCGTASWQATSCRMPRSSTGIACLSSQRPICKTQVVGSAFSDIYSDPEPCRSRISRAPKCPHHSATCVERSSRLSSRLGGRKRPIPAGQEDSGL